MRVSTIAYIPIISEINFDSWPWISQTETPGPVVSVLGSESVDMNLKAKRMEPKNSEGRNYLFRIEL